MLLCSSFSLSMGTTEQPDAVIGRMKAAYETVQDYQTLTEVRNFKDGRPAEIQRFLYSFKKPKHIRLDFETPHHGMVLVYPDKEGKVYVRLSGLAHIIPLHLSPDNPRLLISGSQRIDQTDMGLLIANIAHSVTDERRGEVSITEDEKFVRLRVPALNHFRKSVVTLYRFVIDKSLYLPARVEESTPRGRLERIISFQNLRINTGISDRFLQGG